MNLSPRKLGRTDTHIPPIVWQFDQQLPSAEVFARCQKIGATWLILPSRTSVETVEALRGMLGETLADWSLVLGVPMEALRLRVVRPIDAKLAALGRKSCAAILVEEPSSTGVKAGWPFHRLGQLRDRGVTKLFWIELADAQEAEWIVDQTPAHAVCVPFSLDEQSARYRLLRVAEDLGVAVVASNTRSLTEVAFRAAEPALTAQLVRLPTAVEDVEAIYLAATTPMSEAQRDASWQAYQERVPEPPKPKGAHPPEFG